MAQLLVVGAVFEQGWTKHGNTHAAKGWAGLNGLQFFQQDQELCFVEPRTAIGCRPGRYCPAFGGHTLQPDIGVRVAAAAFIAATHFLARYHGAAHRGRAIRRQPGACVLSKGLQVGHIHRLLTNWSVILMPDRIKVNRVLSTDIWGRSKNS